MPADWCCCWQDKDPLFPFLPLPWLLEVGKEDKGKKGKS